MSNIAVIPIGGVGNRMNNDTPKQFLKVNGKSLYLYTLEKFQNNKNIDQIVIACLDEYRDFVIEECKKYNITKVVKVVSGGKTQLESIFNCLTLLVDDTLDDDKVIIHVGNRPNISENLINRTLDACSKYGSVATFVPEIEVMVQKEEKKVIPRDNVIRIQTPQAFLFKNLKDIISNKDQYVGTASTMCDLFINLNKNIEFIEGELLNFKITYPEDLELFKKII
ncbi:MAG: 2-C-methyl-D-erythritol 4-phosphate cytidylyltransferase [Firmicutes bacterium]|nr:2-C-methyl-D-erythritol 4-phosphate cytidylyltransferase [Bacillota bacterium]